MNAWEISAIEPEKEYLLESSDHTFAQAQSYCLQNGGKLVKITNKSVQNYIYDKYMGALNYGIWLNALQTKPNSYRFKWLDDSTNVTYFDWLAGQPNQLESSCIALYIHKNDNKWCDWPCTSSMSVLCERNVTSNGLLEQLVEQTKDITPIKNILELIVNLTIDEENRLTMKRLDGTRPIKVGIPTTADSNLATANESVYKLIQLYQSSGKEHSNHGILVFIALLMCIIAISIVVNGMTHIYRYYHSIKLHNREMGDTELISIANKS